MSGGDLQALKDVMDYAVNPTKTEKQYYVSGINCDPLNARDQMQQTKRFYDKMDKRLAYHGYQSFAYGEVNPNIAHKIGVQLAEEIWGSRFEVIIATHLDKKHIHNHFVINSVSFADGKKFHSDCKSYFGIMRGVSDRLCAEYGLSVIEPGMVKDTLSYKEWMDEKSGKHTVRGIIREDVNQAVKAAVSWSQFLSELKKRGYAIKTEVKYLAVKPPGKDRYIRLRSLGEDYTEEILRRRVYEKRLVPERTASPPTIKKYRLIGNIKTARRVKLKGFRAMYWRYRYMFRSIQKRPAQYQTRAFFSYRKELLKLRRYNAEMRLIATHKIDNKDQLNSHMAILSQQINNLLSERKEIYAEKRRCLTQSELEVLNQKATGITEALKPLQKELRLCQSIETRTAYMEANKIREQERKDAEKENVQKARNNYDKNLKVRS